jgi:hypothetical protein
MESLLNDNELQLIIKDLVRTSGRSFPGKEMEVKRSEDDTVKSEDDAVLKCAQVNENTIKCLKC